MQMRGGQSRPHVKQRDKGPVWSGVAVNLVDAGRQTSPQSDLFVAPPTWYGVNSSSEDRRKTSMVKTGRQDEWKEDKMMGRMGTS